MNYTIASGDNLWNIVKNNYQCESGKDVMNIVNQIVKENDIDDMNLIYAGAKINLPETDQFISSKAAEESDDAKTKADEFDDWTNSSENYEKSLAGEEVEEFEMFDFDLSTYSSDLKDFAQEYIDKYDADGDGFWNKEEFITMASAGEEIPEEYKEEYEALYTQLFSDLNLDDNADLINAGEFASYLYAADMDWDNYSETLDVASSLDGKLSYDSYQGLSALDPASSAYKTLQEQKQAFFNNYYAA